MVPLVLSAKYVIVAFQSHTHLLVTDLLNVKRAVIGSKGGWKLSTIFLSCKVFHDWSIIKLGNILYLLDGSIFAVLFGTTSHCFC